MSHPNKISERARLAPLADRAHLAHLAHFIGALPLADLTAQLASARQQGSPRWCQEELAGRLVELSGGGASALLTLAFALVFDAQQRGENVAWITTRHSSFFPPDAADGGVDLDALAVVRLPCADDIARAADLLARSGAFGVLVLDLAQGTRVPPPLLTRLSGLARKHDTAILFLTARNARWSSLGSLVSLRAEAWRRPSHAGRYACELVVVKDRHRPSGWKHVEVCRGSTGLR